MAIAEEERSVGGLVTAIIREAAQLLRQEIALAKAEGAAALSQAGTGVALLIAAALLFFAALLGLMAAATLGLALLLPPWAAALVVAAVVMLLGLMLLVIGRRMLASRRLMPHRLMRNLAEDAALARGRLP